MRLKTAYESLKRELFKPSSPMPLCLFRIAFGLVLLEYCLLLAPEVVPLLQQHKRYLAKQDAGKNLQHPHDQFNNAPACW